MEDQSPASSGGQEEEEGRVARSWRLTKAAWSLVRRDRTALTLVAVTALLSAAAGIGIFWALGWLSHPIRGSRAPWVLLTLWPLTFIGTFLNVGLAAAANAALHGQRLSLGEALAVSRRRVGQIALWSLLASGVGILLQEIASRLPFAGRALSWILGAAWGIVTMFAVPIIALEGCTAVRCVRRSGELIRSRWGEGLSGTVAISAWAALAGGGAGLLVGVGAPLDGSPARTVVLVVALVWMALVASFAGATREVFAVMLYRYAADGATDGPFSADDLQGAFTPKRKRRWLRR